MWWWLWRGLAHAAFLGYIRCSITLGISIGVFGAVSVCLWVLIADLIAVLGVAGGR